MKTQPRAIPRLADNPATVGAVPVANTVHASAIARQVTPPISEAPYRPSVVLVKGQEKIVKVYARERWNATDIYLEAGMDYALSATGEWKDGSIVCGPDGSGDAEFRPSKILLGVGSMLGKAERVHARLWNKDETDFPFTKREEAFPWFALIGVIVNGVLDPTKPDQTYPRHETFLIGGGCAHVPQASGYLYCFANDAWRFYYNNRGSVTLAVKRL